MIRTKSLRESPVDHRPKSLTLHTLYSWGHSAGALSITAHLVTNPDKPPFKAAVFVRICHPKIDFDVAQKLCSPSQQSSYTTLLYGTDSQKNQATYDHLVQFTGCTSAPDTLECLRAAPYATLKDAINTTPAMFSPDGLDLTWSMTIDGGLIKKSLKQYINEGCYAKVPVLGGQVDDEGT